MTQYETKDSGERVDYDSGMRRDAQQGKARFDLLLPTFLEYKDQFLTRCAELMARGAEKYGDRNWELANSEKELARFRASAMRHFMQWINGEEDEDHAAAVFFNLMCHESIKHKIESEESEAEEIHRILFPGESTRVDPSTIRPGILTFEGDSGIRTDLIQEAFARGRASRG